MAEAEEIRRAWYLLTHGLDRNVADPRTREILSEASDVGSNFEAQLIGIRRCMRAAEERGVPIDYGWATRPEAYDFTPEPLYQFALFSSLLGLWINADDEHRRRDAFERIVVRQTHGWAVNGSRAEPLAFDHKQTRCGWIQVPFVWDDLLQLSFEAWLRCLNLDPSVSIAEASERAAGLDVLTIDWSPAHPYWNGLISRAIVGHFRPDHRIEAGLAASLCKQIPALQPAVPHQTTALRVDLGNSLAYLAKAFTVAHEAAHILHIRQGRVFSSELESELAADQDAMAALWNDEMALSPEVREGQSQNALWATSGLSFFFGLLVYANLNRGIEKTVSPTSCEAADQHAMAVRRLRAWADTLHQLARAADRGASGEMTQILVQVSRLSPSMVEFCNGLLNYNERIAPAVLRDAALRWDVMIADLQDVLT